jgi:NAD(P)-dependent dehydrogenase (short-subunit alcohol dehydrogenase family)
MDLYLSGKRAVIIGGSRGIGFAIADALATEGAEIAILARDADRLAAAAGQLRLHGGRVLALSADIADNKAVRAAIAQAVEELGGVDILVNNAGASAPRDLADLVDDDILAGFDTKALGGSRPADGAGPSPGPAQA